MVVCPSPLFRVINRRLTSHSFSTLEIFHQVDLLAYFPTHLDSRLTDCQGYQELLGIQTYKKPVTKASTDHVTRKQTAPPNTAVESQDNT